MKRRPRSSWVMMKLEPYPNWRCLVVRSPDGLFDVIVETRQDGADRRDWIVQPMDGIRSQFDTYENAVEHACTVCRAYARCLMRARVAT